MSFDLRCPWVSSRWPIREVSDSIEDPYHPTPPVDPFFDRACDRWVLSRYADVSAALREPALQQASANSPEPTSNGKEDHDRLDAEVKADMLRLGSATLRVLMEQAMHSGLDGLRGLERVDLVRELIHPWSVEILLALCLPQQAVGKQLAQIARRLFYRCPISPSSSPVTHTLDRFSRRLRNWQSIKAQTKLEAMWERELLALSKPLFWGLITTLPSFIAKVWLALLLHPHEMARLVEDPALMPHATEELLRYAGIVHTLYRRAKERVKLGDIWVEKGQLVSLRVDAANYDPAIFRKPYQLNLTRRPTGQLALGSGTHRCVGATLVRMGCMILIPVFVRSTAVLDKSQPIVWAQDSHIRWPLKVPTRWQVARV